MLALPIDDWLDSRHAFSSMIMSGLWAPALACYVAGVFLTGLRLGTRSLSGR